MGSEHLAGCSSLTTDGMLQQLDKMLWNHENSYLYENELPKEQEQEGMYFIDNGDCHGAQALERLEPPKEQEP